MCECGTNSGGLYAAEHWYARATGLGADGAVPFLHHVRALMLEKTKSMHWVV